MDILFKYDLYERGKFDNYIRDNEVRSLLLLTMLHENIKIFNTTNDKELFMNEYLDLNVIPEKMKLREVVSF